MKVTASLNLVLCRKEWLVLPPQLTTCICTLLTVMKNHVL